MVFSWSQTGIHFYAWMESECFQQLQWDSPWPRNDQSQCLTKFALYRNAASDSCWPFRLLRCDRNISEWRLYPTPLTASRVIILQWSNDSFTKTRFFIGPLSHKYWDLRLTAIFADRCIKRSCSRRPSNCSLHQFYNATQITTDHKTQAKTVFSLCLQLSWHFMELCHIISSFRTWASFLYGPNSKWLQTNQWPLWRHD